LRSRTCSRAVSWQCRLTLWGTLDARPSRRGPPGLSSIALCTLCWPALLRRPLAVRSRLGPNVDGVAGRIQRSELLPSRDACGLSNRARRTPVRGGGCLRDGRQRWGRCIQATRDRWFPERPVLTQVRSMGLWIRFSTRSAGVSMDAK